MPSALQSFLGRIRGVFHESALFVSSTEKAMGVSPAVSFKTMSMVYQADLGARASIDFLADQVAGQGFYTTYNEEYQEKSEGKTAKEIVDAFCERVSLDERLQETSRYLVGWGNVFWWVGNKTRIDFLRTIPLEIIKDRGLKIGEDGFVEEFKLDWDRDLKEISGSELIHLPYNVMSASPLGLGILHSLCAPLALGNGETRESFYQIKGKIHSGMADTISTFGAPNELWSFPGLKKEMLQQAQSDIKRIPRRGARFVYNPPAGSEAKVVQVVAERMRGLDFYVETLDDEFVLGLQTPLAKLVTKTGFTEASANAALEIAERRVGALQRFLKRGVERYLFDPVVAAAGLDPSKAQVRLNWGMPESLDYEKLSKILNQVTELVKVNPAVIGVTELRKVLRDVAKLPLEEKDPEAEMASRVLQKPEEKTEKNERA
jgi:hypothetical protein